MLANLPVISKIFPASQQQQQNFFLKYFQQQQLQQQQQQQHGLYLLVSITEQSVRAISVKAFPVSNLWLNN